MGRHRNCSSSVELAKFVLLFMMEFYFLPASITYALELEKNKTVQYLLFCFKINDNKYYCQAVCISYLVLLTSEIACTTGAHKFHLLQAIATLFLSNNLLYKPYYIML